MAETDWHARYLDAVHANGELHGELRELFRLRMGVRELLAERRLDDGCWAEACGDCHDHGERELVQQLRRLLGDGD